MLAKLARAIGRGIERRWGAGGVWPLPGLAIGTSSAGLVVNAYAAENLSTITACVGAISSGLASLPPYVYLRGEAGRVEARDHPVSRLLKRPNPSQTWPDWIETTLGSVLLHGNALSLIETDGAGRPVALTPVPWGNVQPMLMPSGKLAFDVTQFSPTYPMGHAGTTTRYLASEVFHLRDRSDDGLLGKSRLSRAPDVLGNAMALQDWAGSMWRNQATPSGVVQFEKQIPNEAAAQRIRAAIERTYTGTDNARKVMILEGGATWQPMGVSPEDAEVLASRKFTVEELCRLFQVPPPIIQSYQYNTFTNASQASLWFAQLTLSPWARKIEAEFARSVFSIADRGKHELEIDMSGLMRGDYEARWRAHEIAVKNGILSAEEVREVEGWNPRRATETAT